MKTMVFVLFLEQYGEGEQALPDYLKGRGSVFIQAGKHALCSGGEVILINHKFSLKSNDECNLLISIPEAAATQTRMPHLLDLKLRPTPDKLALRPTTPTTASSPTRGSTIGGKLVMF